MRDGELWHGWDITDCQKDEFLVSCTNLEMSDLVKLLNTAFFSTFLGCFGGRFWFWVNLFCSHLFGFFFKL